MNLWTCTVREVQRRPGRMLLTLLGITLGLATVVATRLTIHTIDRAYRDLFEGVSGRSALEVTAAGQGGFAADFVRDLESAPGVKAVIPRIQGAVALVGDAGSVAVPVLGVEPGADDWPLCEGRPLTGDREALLDAGLAKNLGLAPGRPMRLWAPAGEEQLDLAGTLRASGDSAAAGGVLVVSLACAQRLFALGPQVNSVQILLADDADPNLVQARLAPRLPAGLTIRPPGMRGELGRSTLLAAQQGLASLSIVALIAAAFVILNTFLLNLGERRRQVAIFRALGATRMQVTRLLLRETLLLGLFGTLTGCAAGLSLALLLLRVMGQFLGLSLPPLHLHAEPFVLACVLGPGTALTAACVPAWLAGRRPPLAELSPRFGGTGDLLPRWLWLAGLFLLALGGSLEAALCLDRVPEPASRALLAPALAFLLVGSVLSLPVLVVPLLALMARLPLGLVGGLAVRQLIRQRTRTCLTAGVLFLAVAVAIAFSQSLQGVLHDLRHWYRQTIVADFLVRGAMPDSSFLLATALPESLAGEIRRLDGVADVDRIAFVPAEVNDLPVLVLALRTFTVGQPLPLDLHEGEPDAVLKGLSGGEVVLGTSLAQRLGLHQGDRITLATPRGPEELPVAGTAAEYAGGGLALYLEWDTARRLLDIPGVHVFLIRATPGTVPALAPALRALCERDHLLLQSNADLRVLIDQLLARVTGAIWALMALAFAVASLGIVNTLTMNVHDQTRNFGVLRALGLKCGQVRKMVFAQALALGCISLLPGVPAGISLAYAINRSSTAWGGPPIAFQLDSLLVGGCCLLALAVTMLAAWAPARQAARVPVMRAPST